MVTVPVHEIELYPFEAFRVILEHEVNRSHRYGDSLTLIDLVVDAEPASPQNQHRAELWAIHALNVHLRDTDIPCKRGNEFLVLMSATSMPGARTACERIRRLLGNSELEEAASYNIHVYMGLATLTNDDRSISGDRLAQHAARALQHARNNQTRTVVNFSELAD